tara:strand:+ start:655 stop:1041 length:387 start_codon:yes stop_codon:yes gene_type:complete
MIINKKEISFCATKFEINGISYKDMDTRLRTQNLDLYFFKDIDIFKRLQHNKFLISSTKNNCKIKLDIIEKNLYSFNRSNDGDFKARLQNIINYELNNIIIFSIILMLNLIFFIIFYLYRLLFKSKFL